MRWIRHNSIGKQKLFGLQKIFGRKFSIIQFNFANIYHYCENTKQLNNEIR